MSRTTADAAVGMMDGAYFVGRKELLEFFNGLLALKLTKIEQTASGAIACQLTELIFPRSIAMTKVNWEAKSDYEFVQNYKLLQAAFTKQRVQRHVDVDKLIRAKYQDNLEFCQWLKAFYDQSGVHREDYDPMAVRARGKGGKRYNDLMGSGKKSSGGGGAAPRSSTTTTTTAAPTARRPRPAAATGASKTTTQPKATSTTTTTASTTTERPSRPLRERAPGNGTAAKDNAATIAANAELEKKNAELETNNTELSTKVTDLEERSAEMELAVLEIEKERDFYFEKLRNVEVLLQVHQEKGAESDPERLVDKIFRLLYAVADDNLVVNDDGEVVESTSVLETSGAVEETGVENVEGELVEQDMY